MCRIFIFITFFLGLNYTAQARENSVSQEGLKVTSSDGFWIAPGEQARLKAVPSNLAATVKWEEQSDDGTWREIGSGNDFDFQDTSNLASPCMTVEHQLRAVLVNTPAVKPLDFKIRVQNATCTLTTRDGLADNATTKVIVGRGSTVFVGTENGLTQFLWPEMTPTTIKKAGDGREVEIVTSLAQRDNGELWVARAQDFFMFPVRGFGIEVLDRTRNEPWSKDALLAKGYVSSISFGTTQSKGTFPIVLTADNYASFGGSSGGLHSRDLSQTLLSGESLYAILPLEPALWLLGGDHGLQLYSGGSLERMSGPEWGGQGTFLGIGSNRSVRALAMGIDRTVWVGLKGNSSNGGIVRMENFEQVIEDVRALKKRDPRAKSQQTWNVTPLPAQAGNDVRAMRFDDDENLWIATNNGLVKRSSTGVFSTILNTDGIANNDVRDLFYDAKTRYLWIATKNGLSRFSLPQL